MPIECNIFYPGKLERQQPIEPGLLHTYRHNTDEVGVMVLACCYIEDKGGRIYVMEEPQFNEIIGENGYYNSDKLEKHNYIEIPSGMTESITLKSEDGQESTLIFTHNSPN
jgi:hypothetical protein